MNSNIKMIIGFVVGCVAGVAASNKYFKDKYQAIAEEQIDDMKIACRRRIRNASRQKESEKISTDEGYEVDKKEEKKEPPTDINVRRKREPVDYTQYSASILKAKKDEGQTRMSREDMEQEELLDDEDTAHNGTERKEPYVISFEEYDNEHPDYDKLTLTYFNEDDTLTDEQEEAIIDIEGTVGEALTQFGSDGAAKDVVYVRNEAKSIDYEICRSDLSYKHDVLGLED